MYLGVQDVGTYSAAGTTQATATLVVNGVNYIDTVASGAGVVLAPNNTGQCTSQMVYNAGANGLKVYPPSGSNINGLPANTHMVLPINTGCVFWNVTSTQICGNLSA